jgi:hypothetical protein
VPEHLSLAEAVTDARIGHGLAGGLSPIRLPRVRDQVARFVADPGGLLASTFPEHRIEFARAARHLRAADLYWVTPDMAALAVAAGTQLDTIRWAAADRPSACGLVVYQGGVGMSDNVPVDAMTWGPGPDGLTVTMFCGRWRAGNPAVEVEHFPPLIVTVQHDIGGGGGVTPIDAVTPRARTLLRTLAATWALMQQPTIADRTPGPVDRHLARAYQRDGRPPPEVAIVDLRHIYRPDRADDDAGDGRTWRHRWVVRGHWRNQAHGPGRAQRRRIYVPSYVKGPDGAPLLDRERVNVWRR